MKTKPKAIWITGASSGIGKALAIEFAKKGKIVLGTARRIKLLNEIKAELGKYAINFHPYKLDIKDCKEIEKFSKKIFTKYEPECLINNAGITSFNLAEEDTTEMVREIIEVNLLGSIYAIRSVLPEMQKNKSGTIINILSSATQKIFIRSSIYSASKSGLMAYTKVLREELRKDNVRVINISPGATDTEIWPEHVTTKNSDRMMKPESIASLIYKLFSEKGNIVPEEIVLRPITGDL
jgi:short-subunit dehydrogenase